MHIPKLLMMTAFLAAVGVSSLYAQRPDSDAQAKARAALDAAMNAPATPADTTPPPSPVVPKPAPAPKPPVDTNIPLTPAPVTPAPVVQPAPAPTPVAAPAPMATAPTQPVTPAPVENRQLLLQPAPVAAPPPRQATAPLAMPAATPANSLTPAQAEMARGKPCTILPKPCRRQCRAAADTRALPAPVVAAPMTPPAKINPKAPIVPAPAPTMMAPPANAAPAQMPSAADSQEARMAELLLLCQNDQISPARISGALFAVRRFFPANNQPVPPPSG